MGQEHVTPAETVPVKIRLIFDESVFARSMIPPEMVSIRVTRYSLSPYVHLI